MMPTRSPFAFLRRKQTEVQTFGDLTAQKQAYLLTMDIFRDLDKEAILHLVHQTHMRTCAKGQLVLEDYQLRGFPFPWKWLEWAIRLADPEHQSLLSQQEAQRLCQQAGFHVVGTHTFSIDLFCQGWVVRART
jgi:hypothetical protein